MKVHSNMTVGSALAYTVMVLAQLVAVVFWMVGLVVAKGFWSTVFALFPLYAWYLATGWAMKVMAYL